MKVKLLHTTGNRDIIETIWDKPEPAKDEIEVRAVFTGVCSSDVAMYNGDFPTLPKEIQGHEGLGLVTKVGALVETNMGIKKGDMVATRGEPGFADYYNAKQGTFVKVPNNADPKYILEPVACGINVANAVINADNQDKNQCIAIIGTGFLARVTHYALKRKGYTNFIVYGKAYPEYWDKQDVTQMKHTGFHLEMPAGMALKGFDAFIDYSSKAQYMTGDYVNENGIYVCAAEKKVDSIDFSKFLWKNITIKFPSPRDTTFIQSMRYARECIKTGSLNVSDMWCKSYNRDNAKTAFENKLNGTDKGRSYLIWMR
jgi:D-arabinose 1-dehydrogenase-like Zn-dependent alcohol dehydrogenase